MPLKAVSDRKHSELTPDEIFEIFKNEFEDLSEPISVKAVHFEQIDGITTHVTAVKDDIEQQIDATGNGRLDAVSMHLKGVRPGLRSRYLHGACAGKSSSARAIAYVGLKWRTGR